MSYTDDYYNKFWEGIIKLLPKGGSYRFDYRQAGFDIIKDVIPNGSKVFDYACGLGHIGIQLAKEKACKVSGCDWSSVAVDYVNKQVGSDTYKVTDKIEGKYDYIIASQYLEHLKDPKSFVKECLAKTKHLIVAIPNNFRRTGEHIDMAWTSWAEFNDMFQEWELERIDKYTSTPQAWQHPIFIIKEKNTMHPSYRDENKKVEVKKEKKKVAKKKRKKVVTTEEVVEVANAESIDNYNKL